MSDFEIAFSSDMPYDTSPLNEDEMKCFNVTSPNQKKILTPPNQKIKKISKIEGFDASVTQNIYSLPIGTVIQWTTDVPPSGFLSCDGSTISRTTYSKLYSIIGDKFGAGDGTTTFNLPDYRGYTLIGKNLTDKDMNTIDNVHRGEKTHKMTISEMPTHTHTSVEHTHKTTLNDPGHTHTISGVLTEGGSGRWASGTSGQTNSGLSTASGKTNIQFSIDSATTIINNSGDGNAFNVMQPYKIINYCIKYDETMPIAFNDSDKAYMTLTDSDLEFKSKSGTSFGKLSPSNANFPGSISSNSISVSGISNFGDKITSSSTTGGLHSTTSGIAIGRTTATSSTELGKRSIQLATDTSYGGTYDNHTGTLLASTMPSGWGSAQLNIRNSTGWGLYGTDNSMSISKDKTTILKDLSIGGEFKYAGGKTLDSSIGNTQIIYGTIYGNGASTQTILRGTGFTVTPKYSSDWGHVTFTTPFKNTPNILTSLNGKRSDPIYDRYIFVEKITVSGFNYIVRNSSGDTTMDIDVAFTAIGNI